MEYPDEIPSFQPIDAGTARRIFHEELAKVEAGRSPVFDLVVADLRRRDQLGFETFGRPMIVGERDALREAYEEALDLVVYLREELESRNLGPHEKNPDLEEGVWTGRPLHSLLCLTLNR